MQGAQSSAACVHLIQRAIDHNHSFPCTSLTADVQSGQVACSCTSFFERTHDKLAVIFLNNIARDACPGTVVIGRTNRFSSRLIGIELSTPGSLCKLGTTTEHSCSGISNAADSDVVTGLSSYLKNSTRKIAIQQLGSIEFRSLCNTVNFSRQLLDLSLHGFTVGGAIGRIRRLHRQFTHALQHIAHLAQSTFSGLRQRNAIIGIACGHSQAAGLRLHALRDRQASRIVLGAVHAQARRQALHGSSQRTARQAQIALRVDRYNIGINGHCHFLFPFKTLKAMTARASHFR